MAKLPNALSTLRILLAPVLVVLAWVGARGPFLGCLLVAFASDALDGRLARRYGTASIHGARLDSAADLLIYTSLPLVAWWLRPDFVRAEAGWLALAIASYLLPIAVGLARYRRLTSYHTTAARLSAYLVGFAAVVVFAGGTAIPFRIATLVVLVAELEEIAITAVLPAWRADVRSLGHALALRRR